MNTKDSQKIRTEILEKVKEYCRISQADNKFIPGISKVHYGGRVFDEDEMVAMTDSLLDFTLTLGYYGKQFEIEFSELLGVKNVILTNSGSSANLLAVSALCSSQRKRHLKEGDEVITPAVTFPTTLNPIIQNNLRPVLIDVELGSYNIDTSLLEKALSTKTRALMIPHTLGNPNDMDYITDFAKNNELYLIEDACDALDSRYGGKQCGTFGDIGTFSFYPAHHITMGEGGAVVTNDDGLARIVRSVRDWGRACFCEPGETDPNGACGRRFTFRVNGTPYDHKYLYSNIGYNLKPLDLQPAMGLAQLKKLPLFTKARKRNFKMLFEEFTKYIEYFVLPKALPKSDPSWFAFPITVKPKAPFKREDIIKWYERNNIETRLLFSGNITKHPAYKDIVFRVVGGLNNSDLVMTSAFFIGVYPGIGEEQMNYVLDKTQEFMKRYA